MLLYAVIDVNGEVNTRKHRECHHGFLQICDHCNLYTRHDFELSQTSEEHGSLGPSTLCHEVQGAKNKVLQNPKYIVLYYDYLLKGQRQMQSVAGCY